MIEITPPVRQFFDIDGNPLDAGFIYIGVTGANPETNPQQVYWDKDGLIPATQPIRTINGSPARDGAAARIFTSIRTYSITVKNKRGIVVQSTLNSDSGAFQELSAFAGESYINAQKAEEFADIAASTANYKGEWSSLSGALSIPATVRHEDALWMLVSSAADVTAIEPGVSAQWVNVTPITEGSGTFSGSRNRILNGDFRIAQYGAVVIPATIPALTLPSIGAANSAGGHAVDGWRFVNYTNAVLSVARADGTLPDGRTVKWLNTTVSTSDASISSGELCMVRHVIPQEEMEDLFGRTFIIHGYVKSSVTGVHCVALRNAGLDRYFIGEVNIAAPNVAQKFEIVVAGGLPSTGTWITGYSGLEVDFVLASGADFFGTSGSWQTGAKTNTSAQVNALATGGNVFGLAEIQLELGAVALPFERLNYSDALARCQRRYEQIGFPMLQNAYNGGLGSIGAFVGWAEVKRTFPTLLIGTLTPTGGETLTIPDFQMLTTGVVQATAGTFTSALGAHYKILPVIGDARF